MTLDSPQANKPVPEVEENQQINFSDAFDDTSNSHFQNNDSTEDFSPVGGDSSTLTDTTSDLLVAQLGPGDKPFTGGGNLEKQGNAENAEANNEGPVKLEKMKFDASEAGKALELAKKHNLPIAVYTGAPWCHYCDGASPAFSRATKGMESAEETPAILMKVNRDTVDRLKNNGGAGSELLKAIRRDAGSIPNVAVYNPNDLSKPVKDATIGNWGDSSITKIVNEGIKEVNGKPFKPGENKTDVQEKNKPEDRSPRVNDYTEANMTEAAALAKKTGLPLLTYLDAGSGGATNADKALKYLNDNKLAVTATIDQAKAGKMMDKGMDSKDFGPLWGGRNMSNPMNKDNQFSAFDSTKFGDDLRIKAQDSIKTKSTDEVIDFMKKNGVDLSSSEHEAAVRALLEGKPIPEPKPEPEPERKAEIEKEKPGDKVQDKPEGDKVEKAESIFKAKSIEDAKKVIELAKESGKPLVVHADTPVCSGDNCTMKSLDPSVEKELSENALVMEVPMGGFKPEDVKGNKELEKINELFKLDEDAKKTSVDLHLFKFGGENNDTMEHLNPLKEKGKEIDKTDFSEEAYKFDDFIKGAEKFQGFKNLELPKLSIEGATNHAGAIEQTQQRVRRVKELLKK